ncbi:MULTISPECIES: RhuM family protein [Microbacterium]|uniref:RhuM family protein n=1 Tax=Microbacterium TaxID=33882 RepID=UPI00300FC2A2
MAEEKPHAELYRSKDGSVSLEVRTEGEDVWLTRAQLATLFGRDVKTIGKHVANARREELAGLPTVAKFATVQEEGGRWVQRQVEHYNLDMVLSVGYRVKSPEGVNFRAWATSVLKRYVVEGAATNQRRLDEIGSIVTVLARSTDAVAAGVADVLAGYLPSLRTLRDYDEGELRSGAGDAERWVLTYDEARSVIERIRRDFPEDTLLGGERGDALRGVIGAVYQRFGGSELYPTAQEKAANLLYFVIKDHPLSDGNKRTGAALFVLFLERNGALRGPDGTTLISNNALAAITLLIAMSDPKEKDLMIALVLRMLNGEPLAS